MAKSNKKQEALSVGRLINEVLIAQLGMSIKQIVNDTTFSEYTKSDRPDILVSNAEYDGTNSMEFISNLVCYVEAKDITCKIEDKDWQDAYTQGMKKAPLLNIPFFGVTNCKTTYFYNVVTGNKLTLNGNLISEFQTIDVFRIIRKYLSENPKSDNIKMGTDALTSVSEAVFNKKLWELAEEYREIDFANNTQKIDFTIGLIALEYYEEKTVIEGTYDRSKPYWSDIRKFSAEESLDAVTKIISYIDWLTSDESEFREFAPLLKNVKTLVTGARPLVNSKKFYSIYGIIDSMQPLHGTGFDLFGAVYEKFANSKEKKDFGEYFTRRQYSHVLAELLLQSENVYSANNKITIIDPFCGTGGMLTESFKVLRANYMNEGTYDEESATYLAEKCFYGMDIRSENISRTRLNMFLVGDGHTNMFADDSFNPQSKTGKSYLSKKYKYVITNPPYGAGTFEANTDVLSSKRTEIAAWCRIMDLLEINGKACIITPDGVLENPTFVKFRREILETCEVYAIVSLPKFAFAPYTKEKTYAVFVRKLHDRHSDEGKKRVGTGKFQKTPIWMYIIDNDGFANSDKRFPTRLRAKDQSWLHDEVQGYVDEFGVEHPSLLEQRWLHFDDTATNGTEWLDEKGKTVKKRKGEVIKIDRVSKDQFLTLLPEYYLRPFEPSYITLHEFRDEFNSVDVNGITDLLSPLNISIADKDIRYQAQNVPIHKVIDCMSGNTGLTEEFIYSTIQNTSAPKCPVLSSSTEEETMMGEVPVNSILPNGKSIKIFDNKEGLLVIRNGKAGQTRYLPKGTYTINDHAYILSVKDSCEFKIDLRWLAIQYKTEFLSYSSSADNGTWNKTGFFDNICLDIPEYDIQEKIVHSYDLVLKRKELCKRIADKYQDLLDKELFI